jgi:D-alanyl-D-alanine dipeptidase/carboxypeptidase
MKTVKLQQDSIKKGSLILVNAARPLLREPAEDTLELFGDRTGNIILERQTARMLDNVMGAINCSREIIPVSGYRTLSEQRELYENSVQENGIDFTGKYIALPGCSEHHTGLAVDLAENREHIDLIRPAFPYTGICQDFRKKAVEYGFIERYPAGREKITGIAHEPWHFRYVGYPHSRLITQNNATLEEYIGYLKQFQNERLHTRCNGQYFQIFFVPVKPGSCASIEIPDLVPCQLSGNNQDGIIVTLWTKES